MIKKAIWKKVPYGKIGNAQTNIREKTQFRYSAGMKNLSENSKIQIGPCYADPYWKYFSNAHGLNFFRSMFNVTSVATNDKNDLSPHKRLPLPLKTLIKKNL